MNKQNGITLVSLIITIIVMLILAVVVLSMTTGEGSIINKAILAKDETLKDEEIEMLQRSYQVYLINEKNPSAEEKNLAEMIAAEGYASADYDESNDVTYVTMNNSGKIYEVMSNGEIRESVSTNSWFDESKTEYYLYTINHLNGFASLVNEGEDFYGKTIYLKKDIDLKNEEWTPIGTSTNKFSGIFDGENHTISNLKCTLDDVQGVGLFGYASAATVKNVKINNANIIGKKYVGSLIGNPGTTKVENIIISGNIKVEAPRYVGGVLGGTLYGRTTNITVNASNGSYVKSTSMDDSAYVGGVIGFAAEGIITHTNLVSNIDVIGVTHSIGGIVGMAQYGTTFVNCSSSGNVNLIRAINEGGELKIGGIAGVWNNTKADRSVTLTGCSFTGTLSSVDMNGNVVTEFVNNGLIGDKNNPAGTGSLIIN